VEKVLLEGIDDEEFEIDESKNLDWNKQNMNRRDFFLLFVPKNI
jgi:hypothetical protein